MTDDASLRHDLDRLVAKDEIRDCLYLFCRGLDRIDRDLLLAAFHDDAIVDFGKLFTGPAAAFVESTLTMQRRQAHCQHLVGNIVIQLAGDSAAVESYEIARHLSEVGGRPCDMVLASRLLDRFERRDGRWAIARRTKVLDWARLLDADASIHASPPLAIAARDRSDPSYALFDPSNSLTTN